MEEAITFSAAVGAIYDAALDSAAWPTALKHCCDYIGVRTSNLIWRDDNSPAAAVFHSYNFDPEYIRSYFETYAPLDPFYPASNFMPVGQPFAGDDLVPQHELRETRFYKEWVAPQNYNVPMIVNIERSTTASSAWVALRGNEQGPLDDTAKQRFALLAPHIMRAVTIGRTLDFHKATANSLALVLDSVPNAIVLLRDDGGVVHANAAATALLSAGDLLMQRDGRLIAAVPETRNVFSKAVSGICNDARAGRRAAATVAIDGSHADGCLAQILSLIPGDGPLDYGAPAKVVVFLRPVTGAEPSGLEIISKRYRLTAGEMRVLSCVAEGGSVADIAARLGTAPSTVKTHLNNLFAKTGAERQADLVRLMAHGSPRR